MLSGSKIVSNTRYVFITIRSHVSYGSFKMTLYYTPVYV